VAALPEYIRRLLIDAKSRMESIRLFEAGDYVGGRLLLFHRPEKLARLNQRPIKLARRRPSI